MFTFRWVISSLHDRKPQTTFSWTQHTVCDTRWDEFKTKDEKWDGWYFYVLLTHAKWRPVWFHFCLSYQQIHTPAVPAVKSRLCLRLCNIKITFKNKLKSKSCTKMLNMKQKTNSNKSKCRNSHIHTSQTHFSTHFCTYRCLLSSISHRLVSIQNVIYPHHG